MLAGEASNINIIVFGFTKYFLIVEFCSNINIKKSLYSVKWQPFFLMEGKDCHYKFWKGNTPAMFGPIWPSSFYRAEFCLKIEIIIHNHKKKRTGKKINFHIKLCNRICRETKWGPMAIFNRGGGCPTTFWKRTT